MPMNLKVSALALIAAASLIPITGKLLSPQSAQAQFNPEHSPRPERIARHHGGQNLSPEDREAKQAERLAKLKSELNLDDAQVQKLKAIHEKYKPQHQALHEESKALRESGNSEGWSALRAKKQSLRQEMSAEIKKILNEEQFKKWQALRQERKGRWGKNLSPEQREAKQAERLAKLKTDLSLDDAQVEKIQAIHKKYQPQHQALRQEFKALRENGNPDNFQALKEKRQTLHQQMQAEFKEILNEEQFKKFELLRPHHRKR